MKKSDFFYKLPQELIAQTPIPNRDKSRLMIIDRKTGTLKHANFSDLPEFLNPGDCVVRNISRVLQARLLGTRSTGGSVELLLLRDLGNSTWECLAKPGKKTRPGASLSFGNGILNASVLSVTSAGNRIIRFRTDEDFSKILEKLGKTPLPPYITKELDNSERYQTVYSSVTGSAAAPTAGLHFTQSTFNTLKNKGVSVADITLHVGLATFRPVKTENIKDHEMHAEYCQITADTAKLINSTKSNGGRIIAIGTTSCRTLEACAAGDGTITQFEGFTDIFIYPGYKFRTVDGLLTNFHLPESTLIMLAAALAGRENILNAYNSAVREHYRFFSFGDAMLIIDQKN